MLDLFPSRDAGPFGPLASIYSIGRLNIRQAGARPRPGDFAAPSLGECAVGSGELRGDDALMLFSDPSEAMEHLMS